jgi:hypothetical protein
MNRAERDERNLAILQIAALSYHDKPGSCDRNVLNDAGRAEVGRKNGDKALGQEVALSKQVRLDLGPMVGRAWDSCRSGDR